VPLLSIEVAIQHWQTHGASGPPSARSSP